MPTIRPYTPPDEPSWLRCRVLAFLATPYFDDVWQSRPEEPQVQLVAVEAGEVVGLLDIVVDGPLATIDTVAVHPDHQGHGAGTALLDAALPLLPGEVTTLDAWTREHPGTLAWYHARGFAESEHYLHVYLSPDEDAPADLRAPHPLLGPVAAFYHARIEHEQDLRARFRRVHVCRRMTRRLEGE